VPAPIDVLDTLPSDLGVFELGDTLNVSLPLRDREGRELTVDWSIKAVLLDVNGINISLPLNEPVYAMERWQVLIAVVTNPDGTELRVEMTFEVVYPEDGDDDDDITDDDDDDDVTIEEPENNEAKIGPGGIAIIIIGSVALLAGVVYGIYAVAAPVERKDVRKKDEVVDEDPLMDEEEDDDF
jgi:hypothetical protein